MDLVLKLRELRKMQGLSQKDLAKRSGVGEKTISSFETGQRIGSLKLKQLEKILDAYGVTKREFFSGAIDAKLAPWESDGADAETFELLEGMKSLPRAVQNSLLGKFHLMVETASELQPSRGKRPASYDHPRNDWQMLTSRN